MPVYYESKKNKRRTNQDAYIYMEYRINQEALIRTMLVADGMGGLDCGELASWLAREKWMIKLQKLTMSKEFLGQPLNLQIELLKKFSYDAVQEINEEVYRELSDRGVNGGTTMSAAILYWDTLIFSNCGDSPAYYFDGKEGNLKKISKEQNAAEELVREGKIKKGSADYWKHKHMLTDYIGKYRKAEPYVTSFLFQPGDMILLGSDGAFGKMENTVIEDYVRGRKQLPEQIIPSILEASVKLGEEDNQTLLLYQEESRTEEQPKEKKGFFRRRRAVK